ncbi:BCAM0308 family protein [Thermodesulfobacterium thermophilum]|uniref:BCAM0308 family protein n=1 Tax=Thermodesulfobacterium thermophilum TaxID=886 RepID=UPI0003B6505A|nr:BCAM0308 family protein [Thermodesulfobacterium thermophilum]
MSKKGDKWIKHTHVFETTEDPYAMKEAPAGEAICPRCKAVFKDKRWVIDEDLYEELKEIDTVPQLICPGCKKAIEQYAMGYLYISGGFWESHRGDIMKLLNNEYERARNINPLHQIININEEDGTTVIETTTDHLAQRLGRALYRAYKGNLEFKWSKGDKLVRVYWHRDK